MTTLVEWMSGWAYLEERTIFGFFFCFTCVVWGVYVPPNKASRLTPQLYSIRWCLEGCRAELDGVGVWQK